MNNSNLIDRLRAAYRAGLPQTREDLLAIFPLDGPDLIDLFALTNRIRVNEVGEKAHLCGIVNAKSGLCAEDCSFCAQASNSSAVIDRYPLKDAAFIVAQARQAKLNGAHKFSIVTSGTKIANRREIVTLVEAIGRIREEVGVPVCVSLGNLDAAVLDELIAAGITRFHHNLETSERFFPNICSTHAYREDVDTVKRALGKGLSVCSGGIFGLGESEEDIIDLGFTLRDLDVDSVPLNFLNPIAGTKLATARNLTPKKALKIIAVMRLIHPAKSVMVMGGREVNLRDLQSIIFMAGANGLIIGNYLVTKGRGAKEDTTLLDDLGLDYELPETVYR